VTLVLHGGTIRTMDPARPLARTLAPQRPLRETRVGSDLAGAAVVDTYLSGRSTVKA
jgi:hypothetical protein